MLKLHEKCLAIMLMMLFVCLPLAGCGNSDGESPVPGGNPPGSLTITSGTRILVDPDDFTKYRRPMSVQAVDRWGAAAVGATISLEVWPVHYSTGGWYKSKPWIEGAGSGSYAQYVSATFANEDTRPAGERGSLVFPPEMDISGTGKLTPSPSAAGSVSSMHVVTDEDGIASFDLVYLRSHAGWITTEVSATTVVSGIEYSESKRVELLATVEDAESGDLPVSMPTSHYPLSIKLIVDAVEDTITGREHWFVPLCGSEVPTAYVATYGTIEQNGVYRTPTLDVVKTYFDDNGFDFAPGAKRSIEDAVCLFGGVRESADDPDLWPITHCEHVYLNVEIR